MAKLVTIGDSLTQGVTSGAILRTEWAFPAIMARALGLEVPTDFHIPNFQYRDDSNQDILGGLGINIEDLLRFMQRWLGPDIDNAVERFIRFPQLVHSYIDKVEDYYERGKGAQPSRFRGIYHNLGVLSFRVQDTFTVNADYSNQIIQSGEGFIRDDFLGLPSMPMYRAAQRVLNPPDERSRMRWTQLDNLKALVERDNGELESLVLWIGHNDCLGAVVSLKIHDMTDVAIADVPDDPNARRQWNLTHPAIFENDYRTLVEKVAEIIPDHTKVFVGTLAHVTIPPVTQGLGKRTPDPDTGRQYFDQYGRFFMNNANYDTVVHRTLSRADAIKVDQRIDQFNSSIRSIVADLNHPNWHIVDIGGVLDNLAVKRNDSENNPAFPLQSRYADWIDNHPLLSLLPVPSVLRYTTHGAQRLAGGLFSLDGIHPTITGYGIVAEEFLRSMQQHGVSGADPQRVPWAMVTANDTLLRQAPQLWDDIINQAENHSTIWNAIFNFLSR